MPDRRAADAFQSYIDNVLKKNHKGFPSREEEIDLIARAQQGDEKAFNDLVYAHYRMVLDVTRRYEKQEAGFTTDDLFQEGLCGFRRAVQKFKPEFGCRLITYAGWWVQQMIQRYADNNKRVVRFPVSVTAKIRKMRREADKMMTQRGEAPTQNELIRFAELKAKSRQEKVILGAFVSEEISLSRELEAVGANYGSRNSSWQNGMCHSSYEPRADANQLDSYAFHERRKFVAEILGKLSLLEAEVLRSRFYDELNLEETADMLLKKCLIKRRVSGERVRQIEAKALQKFAEKIEQLRKCHDIKKDINDETAPT